MRPTLPGDSQGLQDRIRSLEATIRDQGRPRMGVALSVTRIDHRAAELRAAAPKSMIGTWLRQFGLTRLQPRPSARRTSCPRASEGSASRSASSAHRWMVACHCVLLFKPRRRSSSAIRLACETTSSCSSVFRAISVAMRSAAAVVASGGGASAGRDWESVGEDMGKLDSCLDSSLNRTSATAYLGRYQSGVYRPTRRSHANGCPR